MQTARVANARQHVENESYILHPLVVLLLLGGSFGVVLFFALSLTLVLGKSSVPQTRRISWFVVGVSFLGYSLLIFRGDPGLFFLRDLGLLPGALVHSFPALQFMGVSYCFLRTVSALHDDRRWQVSEFTRYFFFFPTFFSGPIFQSDAFLSQRETLSRENLVQGCARILQGVAYIALAQVLYSVIPLSTADVYRFSIENTPVPVLWVGVYLSGVWLYCNFSGFSHVFIGLSRCFGIEAPENFRRPLATRTLTAFWQSWHISLGDWLRIHLYTPLNRMLQNRLGFDRTIAGIAVVIVTMVGCGAWHGVVTNFLIWGAYHGAGLAVQQNWSKAVSGKLPDKGLLATVHRSSSWFLTQAFVAFGWIFFLPLSDLTRDERMVMAMRLIGF